MRIMLKGVEWQCHSPSHFTLMVPDTDVDLWWSGVAWRIFLYGEMEGPPYATRDEAAQAIADGIDDGSLWLLSMLVTQEANRA
jgi:hypothetical protein